MKRPFDVIDNTLKSVKFALFLMLLIGSASIYGTIYPARTPYDFNLYKSVPFILLLFIFAIHIAYCTVFRLIRQTKARLSTTGGGKEMCRIPFNEEYINNLKKAGFKAEEKEGAIYIHRGTLRVKLILLIHIALILLLVAVGLSSMTGFLGTANVHVSDKLTTCFDWNRKTDVPLPFEIIVDKAEIVFYPMPIKVLAEDMKSKERLLITTRESELIKFGAKTFKITKADPSSGKMKVLYIKDGTVLGPFENVVTDNGLEVKFTLKAYIDPVPKQYTADIAIFENRVEKASKKISINDPLFYNGYRIYLLNIDKDQFNFDFVGFQITKEPFMGLVWFSSILLCLTLFVYPFIKEYRLRVEKKGEEIIIYALPPFSNADLLIKNLIIKTESNLQKNKHFH